LFSINPLTVKSVTSLVFYVQSVSVSDSVATIITKRHPVIIHYRQEDQTLIQKQTPAPQADKLSTWFKGDLSPASANAR
jgi:hypothetical protein